MSISLIVAAGLVLLIVYFFNSLISLKTRAQGALADIDVQLKKRHDLIPNLVEVVKGYSKFERETLEKIVSLRNQAQGASGLSEKAGKEEALGKALGRLIAVAENYPALKANEQYLSLQTNLVAVENDLEHARRYYNAVVRDFNTLSLSFPQNLVAAIFQFKPLEFFGAQESDRSAVEVKL